MNAANLGMTETDLKSKIHGLAAGYAMFNLLKLWNDNRLKFGEWNDRPVDDNKAQEMYNSILTHGDQGLDPDNFVELVAHKHLIDFSALSADMHAGSSLPELVVIMEAFTLDDILHLAGGRHRLNALLKWSADVQKLLEECEQRIEYLKSLGEDENKDDDSSDTISALEEKVSGLTALKDRMGMWGARVFDWGTFSPD